MLTLHNKDFTTKYGTINTTIEAFVEEERNGLFELSFIMLNTDSLFNYVKEDNIVVANANDTLLNQKFRIYMTRKLMNNRVEVFARHISFDLMYDYIDNISFENQSCEYALNMLFRNSNFSKHYKGYSDIINAQDYNMSMANILEAIGGKEGSIIDTFGTGAELLRDNENIHVLNKRGHDNSVSIEYKKNLTGFELEEDTTELITRILPYAKYSPQDSEGNSQDEVVIKANYVDSPLIANYSHPFIKAIDYSDKFDDENIPTVDKLRALAGLEYKNNKVDIPKQNFKIEFIPLSKCVGYEALSDNISLCDTVTILDTRYNINTQAKVIKTTYNVLKNRYESMELGEPKTTLGDIVGSGKNENLVGPPGPQGPPGVDGSIGDFPNSLPSAPVVTAKVYGFANIEISWTFENKVYYQYEVYASKEANFIPNSFNLIHSGQTSTYMYQAKPGETWHFKVCCINSHGERTDFGTSYATTTKIDDLSNYVGEMAIGEALIGTLSLDRGWVGELKGNYIDAKQLSVTDGNGKRTLDIDSFGNVNLDVNSLKISSNDVSTKDYVDNSTNFKINEVKSELSQTANNLEIKFKQAGGGNLLYNSNFARGLDYFSEVAPVYLHLGLNNNDMGAIANVTKSKGSIYTDMYEVADNLPYSLSIEYERETNIIGVDVTVNAFDKDRNFIKSVKSTDNFPVMSRFASIDNIYFPTGTKYCNIFIDHLGSNNSSAGFIFWCKLKLSQTSMGTKWTANEKEINGGIFKFDINGMEISQNAGAKVSLTARDMYFTDTNGKKAIGMYKGNLNSYNPKGEFLGVYAPFEDNGKHGQCIVGSQHCEYQMFGKSYFEDDEYNTMSDITPLMTLRYTRSDADYEDRGTHIQNFPLYLHDNIAMNGNEIQNTSRYYIGDSYRNKIEHMPINDSMTIGFGDKLIFSRTTDNGPEIAFEFLENEWVDNFRHWNFKHFQIINANIVQTQDLSEENKYLLNASFAEYDNESNKIKIDHNKLSNELYLENIRLKKNQEKQEEEIITNMLASTEMFELMLSLQQPSLLNIENRERAIIEIYVKLISKGIKNINDVPQVVRNQIENRLNLTSN